MTWHSRHPNPICLCLSAVGKARQEVAWYYIKQIYFRQRHWINFRIYVYFWLLLCWNYSPLIQSDFRLTLVTLTRNICPLWILQKKNKKVQNLRQSAMNCVNIWVIKKILNIQSVSRSMYNLWMFLTFHQLKTSWGFFVSVLNMLWARSVSAIVVNFNQTSKQTKSSTWEKRKCDRMMENAVLDICCTSWSMQRFWWLAMCLKLEPVLIIDVSIWTPFLRCSSEDILC